VVARARDMNGRWADDVSPLAPHIKVWTKRPGGVPQFHPGRQRKPDVPTAPGLRLECCRKRALSSFERGKGFLPRFAVQVQNYDTGPRAGCDGKVRRWPLLKPRPYCPFIAAGVPTPVVRQGVFRFWAALRVSARAFAVHGPVDGKHGEPPLGESEGRA